MNNPRINVTKTFMPPMDEYVEYLKVVWESGHITNKGPLLVRLEDKLSNFLEVEHLQLVTNGTMALQMAIRALDVEGGEIITTPFSYVATTSAILWEHSKPIFVDIDPQTFCIDPKKIEAAITDKTTAILAVHVFGNPCDIEAIEMVAKRHKLKVIYDGAHAFGTQYKGKSLLSHGDISISSFHATKTFHTIEGGCVVAKDGEVAKKIDLMKRFGHQGDKHIMLGINAKASEFQAAMGLVNLKYVQRLLESRKKISQLYDSLLGSNYQKQLIREETDYNYAYYPIVFPNERDLLKAVGRLQAINVYPRRYFFPSLNTLSYIEHNQHCPSSEALAKTVLCLPLYEDLQEEQIMRISEVIRS